MAASALLCSILIWRCLGAMARGSLYAAPAVTLADHLRG